MPSTSERVIDNSNVGAGETVSAERVADNDHIMAQVVVNRSSIPADEQNTVFSVTIRQFIRGEWVKRGGASFAGGDFFNRRGNIMPFSTYRCQLDAALGRRVEVAVRAAGTALSIQCDLDLFIEGDI